MFVNGSWVYCNLFVQTTVFIYILYLQAEELILWHSFSELQVLLKVDFVNTAIVRKEDMIRSLYERGELRQQVRHLYSRQKCSVVRYTIHPSSYSDKVWSYKILLQLNRNCHYTIWRYCISDVLLDWPLYICRCCWAITLKTSMKIWLQRILTGIRVIAQQRWQMEVLFLPEFILAAVCRWPRRSLTTAPSR